MICLQENVCFLHSILLQGLCVSPPVNTCVRERWSAPCRLCFTGRVDEAQAFINHKLFTHFLPHCQVSCLNLSPRVFHFLLLYFFSYFFFLPGKLSNPNPNRGCLLRLRHCTNKYLSVIYKNRLSRIQRRP